MSEFREGFWFGVTRSDKSGEAALSGPYFHSYYGTPLTSLEEAELAAQRQVADIERRKDLHTWLADVKFTPVYGVAYVAAEVGVDSVPLFEVSFNREEGRWVFPGLED